MGTPGTAFMDSTESPARAIDEWSLGFLDAGSIPGREKNICHGRAVAVRGAEVRRTIIRSVYRWCVGDGPGILGGRATRGLHLRSRGRAMDEQNRWPGPDRTERSECDGSGAAALVS